MASVPNPQMAGRQELLKSQLAIFLDAYKHHYELFLKGMLLYLAAIGAVAAYIYRDGVAHQVREMLSIMVGLGSAICVIGCISSWRWVGLIETRVNKICSELGVVDFPFMGAKHVTLGMSGIALIVAITALLNFFLIRYRVF